MRCVISLQESVTPWWRQLASLYDASDADLENGLGQNKSALNADCGGKSFASSLTFLHGK